MIFRLSLMVLQKQQYRKNPGIRLPSFALTSRNTVISLPYRISDAKNDELTKIFAGGTPDEKKKVYELLIDLDPTRQSIYDEINREH